LSDRQTGRSKGVAFVEFATVEAAQKCVNEGGNLDGRDLKINFSNQKPANAKPAIADPSAEGSDTLFCGNLSFTATEDDLRALFESIGELRDIRIAKD
jgi:nucleolin